MLLLACGESHDVPADGGSEPDDLGGPARIDARGCRPDADFLSGGGRSFAECKGECTFELSLSSVITLGDSACVSYGATLRVSDERGQLLYVANGDLSDAAWDRAAIIGSKLRVADLQDRYGCPDCGAGRAAWLQTASAEADPRQHTYPFGSPPAPLSAADRLLQSLIEQLRSCQGADLLSCSRSPPG
jgi:hypothetical protein